MYRSGRISHHQLETYHKSLKARGIDSGLGKLLKKPAQPNDPISRETNRLRRLAEQRGCGRFDWTVLDWNTDAQALYASVGAELLPSWRICRVEL